VSATNFLNAPRTFNHNYDRCLSGVLPSTMKQVGLGRGCIRLPVSSDQQSTVGGPRRRATTSSAFNVDALVGRPNIVTGGCYAVNDWTWKQSSDPCCVASIDNNNNNKCQSTVFILADQCFDSEVQFSPLLRDFLSW